MIATQNPVEHHGTYPLPEAQLDRFAMKLSVGYPERNDELDLLADAVGDLEGDSRRGTVLSDGDLIALQEQVARVVVQPNVRAYLVDLGRATRNHPKIALGLSPRGLLIWQRVAQAWAFLKDRPFVTPDDIQEVAGPVLSVRLSLPPDIASGIVNQLLETVPVPV